MEYISSEISHFYFSISQIGQNLSELFQIELKKSLNPGSVSDRFEIGTGRSVCSGLSMHDYAKDGVPEVVWHLCSFYQDPLRS